MTVIPVPGLVLGTCSQMPFIWDELHYVMAALIEKIYSSSPRSSSRL